MQIADRTVVRFHYELKNNAGETLESSPDTEPTAYLHGAGNILPALEKALVGHSAGEFLEVHLQPGEAFGERREGQQQRVPAKYLRHEGRLRPGQVVRLQSGDGMLTGTVLKVGKFSVDVDLNHPLAGQPVTFAVTIVEVRKASAEELAHGHAHGVGGHHH